ncbi:hypothetical protein ACIPW5_36970 [Streptomyces sp. NPDC090077]|uniref:hypothetical protein n=1 Tax=Streptomyces sp. NPDC090077 TaxID=3365938 RepID=UPI003801F3F1
MASPGTAAAFTDTLRSVTGEDLDRLPLPTAKAAALNANLLDGGRHSVRDELRRRSGHAEDRGDHSGALADVTTCSCWTQSTRPPPSYATVS